MLYTFIYIVHEDFTPNVLGAWHFSW